MYIRLRLLIAFNFLLLVISGRSLIAQQNESNFIRENNLDDFRKLYEKVLEDDRTNYDALTNLGVIYQQIGDMKMSLGMRFNRMELLLTDVYFKTEDYEKAMKYAKLDETENPSQAEGHYLLGVVYEMNGEKNKAKFEFDKAFAIARQNPNSSLTFDINIFFESNTKQ